MRPSLEEMEQIDAHLRKEMSGEELRAFEAKLQGSPELQLKVNYQKNLFKGIDRKAFKQKANASFHKFKWIRKMWIIAAIFVGILLIAILCFILMMAPSPVHHETFEPEEEQEEISTTLLQQQEEKTVHPEQHEKPRLQEATGDTATFDVAPLQKNDSAVFSKPAKNKPESIQTYHPQPRGADTLWSGKNEQGESVNMLIAKFSVAQMYSLMLLEDGTVSSNIPDINGKVWMWNEKKTKLMISTQYYSVKWVEKDKSFKVKIPLKDGTFSFVVNAGADPRINNGVKMQMKVKDKK
ncbi:MAG: hypothetical protein ACKOXB_07855 [Flavobacteriales bacterium]